MPLDGAALAGVVNEISILQGGRVDKIAQPEPDEIFLAVRAKGTNYKLLLTVSANAPRVNFTEQSKISPLKAPMFCMVLRKHLSGGRIISIRQPDFERIVEFEIEALDEMGDRSAKTLIIEIMGKHSNIILTDGAGKVLDAIKHISPAVSSVRTILPGVLYSRPPGGKSNPLEANHEEFSGIFEKSSQESLKIQQAIFQLYNGISPVLAGEICSRAEIHPDTPTTGFSDAEKSQLYGAFSDALEQIKQKNFQSAIYWDESGRAVDFAALPLSIYDHLRAEAFESTSLMLEAFYAGRDEAYRIKQKTADLRKLVVTHQERARKKATVYEKTLDEIKNRDELRIKGELLTAYLYMIPGGAAEFTAENFYDNNKPLTIPLDPALTPPENAQKYFNKYNKQKRTFAALQEQIVKNQEEIAYLESVLAAMDSAIDEADISQIREELAEQGFAKRRGLGKNAKNKKASKESKPLKYTSSDGFDIYVGKNNTQNDYLTLKFARANDIWMHTKDIPGSHVVVVTGGKEPSATAIMEGAQLAAFYSRARLSSQVPVDYVIRKHVRKPAGAKPGYVIYDFHNTVYVTPADTPI
ncbi:MAG: NFACT family protein [Defluviitaleaceae bacterium]|nr:NFACT family protein [Defluviitaleaceae bacterium]